MRSIEENRHGKLPACGWLLIACGFEHKQTKGRRSRTDPTVELIQAHGRRLKAADRQLAVSVNLSLLGQYLLEQIQRSGIAGLAQPEHCLLPDLGILVRLRDCNQRGNSFIPRTLR